LLSDLEAILRARSKLKEEQEKATAETAAARLRWTRELALETAKGVNMQSVVTRCRDLSNKELRQKELDDSLSRALHELDRAIQHYEQVHRQDLLQALQSRLEQVGGVCKEYTELEKWRDQLLRSEKTGESAGTAQKGAGKRKG